ncbi:protein of unknown function [Pseudomonas mediterranea]
MLAMAAVRPTLMQADPTPSRAGSHTGLVSYFYSLLSHADKQIEIPGQWLLDCTLYLLNLFSG